MNSRISPSAFIGDNVQIGERVSIGPGAVLLGPCVIEDDAWIGPGAQLGAPPEMTSSHQSAAWDGEIEHAGVVVRHGAVIRELAVIHQGTYRATTIGKNSWILNRAYIAHDVLVGNETTLSAGVSVGGHCAIGSNVNVGMNASIHQRTTISGGCMVGMGTPLARDLPPFTKAFGSPARIRGINSIGMARLGINDDAIEMLERAYRNGDVALATLSMLTNPLMQTIVEEWRNTVDSNPATFALN